MEQIGYETFRHQTEAVPKVDANQSSVQLMWRKAQGCYRLFGIKEVIRRSALLFTRTLQFGNDMPDASFVTEWLSIGAAPKSETALRRLIEIGFTDVIDLRAERAKSDLLSRGNLPMVEWVPTYDDWRPKSPEFFENLEMHIRTVLAAGHNRRLFICCAAGEHRAPLGGVLALVILGFGFDVATVMVRESRSVAELLPTYLNSLEAYLKGKS